MEARQVNFLDLLDGQVQYVVPRWQRRYRWGKEEIERLVEDLLTVAVAGENASHYGGTLLTFPEPGGPPGVVKCYRVVDGQQRLTTVSLLLMCIAEGIESTEVCEGWSSGDIKNLLLFNQRVVNEKRFKLRLQDGDNEEYQSILRDSSVGISAVGQARKILIQLVKRHDVCHLIRGLTRLQVVSIGLHENEDPQQIFESINATGRPLTESEKVKNWLLIGYSESIQDDLFRQWSDMEKTLGAPHSSWPIDEFLRDLLRWKTGKVVGQNKVYEEFRRWAVRSGRSGDRAGVCTEVVRLSKLYGLISVTPASHPETRVREELNHLRHMGIHTHRPLTLRLLNDAASDSECKLDNDALIECLELISTWITRLWATGRSTSGMNRAITELAYAPVPEGDYTQAFLARITKLQNTHVGIPSDSQVEDGIHNRKAYGGSATATSFELLYYLNQKQNPPGEAIDRSTLTVEHVMPQKLTKEWAGYLGTEAETIHGRYRDCLANLTLCGDETNPSLGTQLFGCKKETYAKSPIFITRDLATEDRWNEETLERRARLLASMVVECWPWTHQVNLKREWLKWRIDETDWRQEATASDMVVNVASALVTMSSENIEKLQGELLTQNIFAADDPRVETSNLKFTDLPGRSDMVIHPYSNDYGTSIKRVREMCRKCGASVEMEEERISDIGRFWKLLKQTTGGIRGQKSHWKGPFQQTTPLNSSKDQVCVYVGNPESLWLYIRSGQEADEATIERMLRYSLQIQEEMGDQQLGTDFGKDIVQYAKDGISVTVLRNWIRDDESQWSEAAVWILEQHDRLMEIVRKYETQ